MIADEACRECSRNKINIYTRLYKAPKQREQEIIGRAERYLDEEAVGLSAPRMMAGLLKILKEETGIKDPYEKIKKDYDLLLRLYAAGMRGVNLPKVLYYIRRDEEQYRRRKYRFRFHEAYVKCRGFYKLGLMPLGIVYAAKPLLVGLIPVNCTKILQKYYYKHRKCTVNIYKKRMQEQKGYYIKCRLRK